MFLGEIGAQQLYCIASISLWAERQLDSAVILSDRSLFEFSVMNTSILTILVAQLYCMSCCIHAM